MTPGPLGFYWTAALIQAIKVVVTFVLKKKKRERGKKKSIVSLSAVAFFFFLLKEPNTACAALHLLCLISISKTRKVGKAAESGFLAIEARRSESVRRLQTAGRPQR